MNCCSRARPDKWRRFGVRRLVAAFLDWPEGMGKQIADQLLPGLLIAYTPEKRRQVAALQE
jgi:hypothetical protein